MPTMEGAVQTKDKDGIKARRKERLRWDEMLLETAAAIHDTSAREHQEQTQTEREGAALTISARQETCDMDTPNREGTQCAKTHQSRSVTLNAL